MRGVSHSCDELRLKVFCPEALREFFQKTGQSHVEDQEKERQLT
jgi:hypothetical protein